MPNQFECQTEIGPMAKDLAIKLGAGIWENETGTVPAESIVSASETYYVIVWWELVGGFKRHLCGKWQVKIDLESIGTAGEYTSDVRMIDMDPCKDGPFVQVFPLTPGTLTPHPAGTVYLVAVTLSSLDPCGDPGHIWGYCKGETVMFVP